MPFSHFDTIVIGAGLSGLAATAKLAQDGLRTALVTVGPGSLVLGAGSLFVNDELRHRAEREISQAIDLFKTFAQDAGCPFEGSLETLRYIPTLLGQFQPVSFAPSCLSQSRLSDMWSCAIVGIDGVTSFDADFMADRLTSSAVEIGLRHSYRARHISLPRKLSLPLTTISIAGCFDRDEEFRSELFQALHDAANGADSIIIPGVLGLKTADSQLRKLRTDFGCSVSEMITLPPSVPGLRMSNLLERQLRRSGVEIYSGYPVRMLDIRDGHCAAVEIDTPARPLRLEAASFVLAMGHRTSALLSVDDLEADEQSRPLAASRELIASNLFAALPVRCGSASESNALKVLAGYRAARFAAMQEGQYVSR